MLFFFPLSTTSSCHLARSHFQRYLNATLSSHQNVHKAVPMFRNCDYDIMLNFSLRLNFCLKIWLAFSQSAEREDFRRVKTRWKFQRVSRRKAIIMISVGFAGKNLINKIHVCEQFSIGKRVAREMHLGSGVEKKRKKTFPKQRANNNRPIIQLRSHFQRLVFLSVLHFIVTHH